MTGNGNDWNSSQTCDFLHFFCQYSDRLSRENETAELFFLDICYIQQFLFEAFGARIQHLGSRSDGIFCYHFTGQHIA